MQMKLEVTHLGKTHKLVTSRFPEMDNPVFIHYSVEQNLKKASRFFIAYHLLNT